MSFICDNCGKSFSRFFNLQRHCKNAHDIILQTQKNNNKEKEPEKHANPNKSSESYSCPIQECDFVGNKTKNFDLHFTNDHPNLEIDKKEMSFQNVEEFMTWKSSVEKQNKCRFVIHTGRTAKYEYYYCHRSGRFTSERTGKRFLKTQGSCKFGSYCPAKICAKISDCGKFNVTFVSTHVGHQHDVAHLTISPNTKKQLAQKMLLKIPDNVIIEDIQESVTDDIQRVHLLTKQDLYNIRREFKIPIDDSKKDENDAISVDLLVQQLRKNDAAGDQENDSSSVLFYKPQDRICEEYPVFKEEDFMVIIMNNVQSEMLKTFGQDVITFDGTHGMSYDFQLYTVMVLDEIRQGFPCCFIISNREDEAVLTFAFSKIRDKVGTITAKVFMSDMATHFYNAWETVMGSTTFRLYCSWHVLKAWNDNLVKVKDDAKREETSNLIQSFQQELDKNSFETLLKAGMEKLLNDEGTVEFANYFYTNYVKDEKFQRWAYCYRTHSGLNSNMHIERMHRTIKYVYLKAKKVKRFDKCLTYLLKFLRTEVFKHVIMQLKGIVSIKVKHLRNRHRTSLTYENSVAVNVENESWIVTSQSDEMVKYNVEWHSACKSDCKLSCSECKACIHNFICSCYDNSITWNMCKHIHQVCAFINLHGKNQGVQGQQAIILPQQETERIEPEDCVMKEIMNEIKNKDTGGDEAERRTQSLLIEEITEMIKTPEDNTYFTNELIKLKNHFLLKNSAVQIPVLMSKPTDGEKKTKIQKKADSSSNIIPQRRLYSTKKKTTSKRKKIIKKPTLAEKAAVSSVNFLIPSLQGPQKTGNVILLSQKDVNE
ncbi:uncharacterized protein LOC135847677 [Planococcus citri]|uniref:uncharacterized protein LOC135847611 n=1 Tax=Planococcus citri TaxID=170843 RepID=UPI0031FA3E24